MLTQVRFDKSFVSFSWKIREETRLWGQINKEYWVQWAKVAKLIVRKEIAQLQKEIIPDPDSLDHTKHISSPKIYNSD